jgi:hypothetical protein
MTTPAMTGLERPRPRRWPWTVLALLTALAVIAPTGARMYRLLALQTQVTSASYRHPITTLQLSGAGVFSVSPGPAGLVSIRRTLRWVNMAEPVIRQAWHGRTLAISVGCGKPASGLPAGISGRICGIDVNLQVPPDVAVKGAVATGAVSVAGIAGDLHLDATAGTVRLAGVSGAVWARATSGAISGSALASAHVDAVVSSGSANLQFSRAPQLVGVIGEPAGQVSVTVPNGTRYRLNAGGGTTVEQPGLIDAASSRVIDIALGPGGKATVSYPSANVSYPS